MINYVKCAKRKNKMKTENWSPNAVISNVEIIGYPDRSQFFGVLREISLLE